MKHQTSRWAWTLALLLAAGPSAARADARLDTQPASTAMKRGADLLRSGKYDQAIKVLRGLGDQRLGEVAVAIMLDQALAMRGRYDKALEAVAAAEGRGAEDPAWQRAMAEALGRVGRYEDALPHARRAHELAPTSAPAILTLGRLLEALGRPDEAQRVYETTQRVLADGAYKTLAGQLVSLGQILDRYALLKGLKASEQANNIFNNYFQVAYQDVDESCWQAHVAAGQFALGKHRPLAAGGEFAAALKINPKLPVALAGLAELAFRDWQFERCIDLADEALAINPVCAEALAVKAQCLLQWRKLDQALSVATKALQANPNDEQALSLAAAASVRLGRLDDAEQYAKRVGAVNPRSWVLPATVAQWLSAGRQFDQAEDHFKKAVDLAPNAAEALTGLGLLYMQTGQEDLARGALKRAHEIDDFRADVVNYLNLLKRMQTFETLETPHFIIAVDGADDAVLLRQVADEAERIYAEVCKDFAHKPPQKTKIQIFPTHNQFSIRITGKGWIGTVGACTGRVIVMVAPSDARSQFGTYNWATVLRHEFTHAVTLSATENRIPHWFTEACAVWQQPDRRNFDSVRALVAAVREGRLTPVRQLDWGFIRPQRRGDRSLAYAQSELVMEFIIETKGFEAILAMLKAFRDGQTQEQVFQKVLGLSESRFDETFARWARNTVVRWGFDVTPSPKFEQAAAAAKAKPDDAAAQGAYARALLRRGKADQAKAAAEKALELQADQDTALTVLAQIALGEDDFARAATFGERLELASGGSAMAARILADAYLGAREYSPAIAALERLKQRRPLDPYSYQWLTVLYAQLGQVDQALPNLVEMHRRTMTEQQFARQIADAYRAAGEDDRALSYYRQVTHINPYEASAYEAMAAIHRNAGRYDQAVTAARCLTLLQPGSPDAWAKLAMVRFVAARAAKDAEAMRQARREATRSLELDADGPGGPILDRIDEALKALDQGKADRP